jgi:hypothetical protein
MSKVKRFILILFFMCIVNDICVYTTQISLKGDQVVSFSFFTTQFESGLLIVNGSLTFLGIVSFISFIKYFFSDN